MKRPSAFFRLALGLALAAPAARAEDAEDGRASMLPAADDLAVSLADDEIAQALRELDEASRGVLVAQWRRESGTRAVS
jgi:hypothetical protein